jgi:hydrogenase-4 component F
VIAALVWGPALAGGAAFATRSRRAREVLLVGTALGHAAGVGAAALAPAARAWRGWLGLDALGLLFLAITSALFLAASLYTVGYLRREPASRHSDLEEGFAFSNEPEAVFVGCLLLFLASMTLVTLARHLGLLWVAVEATTLSTAPLIYFHRQHRSLEATWKYLLVCSVGIGLALLGNLFLAVASMQPAGGGAESMLLDEMLKHAAGLRREWLEASFLLVLVGYGTKMGLAPMHTWLPDAHSESPSLVSALLSGALLNCAFLGILRSVELLGAAGDLGFTSGPLRALGLLSMGVAALFILRQPDYKRMLAYSSVEHMGVLALGVGLGGAAVPGALLHALNHSLAKAMLFLLAGNLLARFATKRSAEVRGALRATPITAALWLAGFFAIAGSPPFGLFVSEFAILRGALASGASAAAALYLTLLGVIFVAMAAGVLPMALGPAPAGLRPKPEPWSAWLPPALLGGAVLVLGVWVPAPLARLLERAAALLGAAG